MGIGEACNAWWMDVLENGPSSSYASYFDIDWHPVNPQLENKVLLPILEDQYGNVLEEGKLRLAYEDGAFFIHYYDTKLPVGPRTYSSILGHRLDQLTETLGKDNESLQELQIIPTAISYLPPGTEVDPEKLEERKREKEIIKRRIGSLLQADPQVRDAIDMALREFKGTVGEPQSFDLLDGLIEAQPYRLAFWRVAGEEINYRRSISTNWRRSAWNFPRFFRLPTNSFFGFLRREELPACGWTTQMASGTRRLISDSSSKAMLPRESWHSMIPP